MTGQEFMLLMVVASGWIAALYYQSCRIVKKLAA